MEKKNKIDTLHYIENITSSMLADILYVAKYLSTLE